MVRPDQTGYGESVSDEGSVYNVYEAKTHLSKLLERVEAGEEITIARHGRPVARLAPIPRPGRERRPGALKGKIHYLEGDALADTDPELVDMMENGPIEPPDHVR